MRRCKNRVTPKCGGAQVVLAVAANVLFTVQARRAAAARVGAVQPMLRAPGGVAYQEPSTWSTATLARCSLVAFLGGSVAGAPTPHLHCC